MAVISYASAGILFPGILEDGRLAVDNYVRFPVDGVYEYSLPCAKLGVKAFSATAIGTVRHRDAFGRQSTLGGPLYQVHMTDDGARDARGRPGLTVTDFWDMRGDSAVELPTYQAENILRATEKAVVALRTTLDALMRNGAMLRGADMDSMLIDCLRARPPVDCESYELVLADTHTLRDFALVQLEQLLPAKDFAIIKDAATDPAPGPRGEPAPGGGATVYQLFPRKK